VIGRCGRTNSSEFERSSVSTFKRKKYVRTKSEIFFFFKQRYLHNKIITNTTHKLKYLHIENIYKNTSTPPPNLKRHIAHNVTELTNLGDGSI
jgi:hypothetical protein